MDGVVLLAVVSLLAVLALAAGAAVATLAVLAVRRLVRQLTAAATVRGRALTVGPRGEVARAQLALRREVAAAGRAVDVARARGWALGDCPSLVARLRAAAAEVDAALDVAVGTREAPAGDRGMPASTHPGAAFGTARPRRDAVAGLLAQARSLTLAAGDLRAALVEQHRAVEARTVESVLADCATETRVLRGR